MSGKLRRNFSGAFSAENLGHSVWRLSSAGEHSVQIFLRDADRHPVQSLGGRTLRDVGVEWHDGRVLLTLLADDHVASFAAAGIFAHEPLPGLFKALPLEQYDARARRFWGRIFRVVRLPGGPFLLRILARKAR